MIIFQRCLISFLGEGDHWYSCFATGITKSSYVFFLLLSKGLVTPSVCISFGVYTQNRYHEFTIVIFRQSDPCHDTWKLVPDPFLSVDADANVDADQDAQCEHILTQRFNKNDEKIIKGILLFFLFTTAVLTYCYFLFFPLGLIILKSTDPRVLLLSFYQTSTRFTRLNLERLWCVASGMILKILCGFILGPDNTHASLPAADGQLSY